MLKSQKINCFIMNDELIFTNIHINVNIINGRPHSEVKTQ